MQEVNLADCRSETEALKKITILVFREALCKTGFPGVCVHPATVRGLSLGVCVLNNEGFFRDGVGAVLFDFDQDGILRVKTPEFYGGREKISGMIRDFALLRPGLRKLGFTERLNFSNYIMAKKVPLGNLKEELVPLFGACRRTN